MSNSDPDRWDIAGDVSLDEQLRRQDEAEVTEDDIEATAEGLAYRPPDTAPVLPGGDDNAVMVEGDVDSTQLAGDIQDALAGNRATSGLTLSVRVRGNIAHLYGAVAEAADAEEAVSTVLAVPGIDQVEDHIELMA
jgi:hypothetical protein